MSATDPLRIQELDSALPNPTHNIYINIYIYNYLYIYMCVCVCTCICILQKQSFPWHLAVCQIWSPVTLTKSNVRSRFCSVPWSFSFRVVGWAQVCSLNSECVGLPAVCVQLFEQHFHKENWGLY